MGGGDLNLKKSWHPNTLKNQERVWKAEQAKQEEQRKLDDLRKEIHEERDREELRRIGENSGVLNSNGGEAKLEWMYKNSAELINREEYLLGRKIDKSFEQLQAEEKRQEQNTLGVKQSINHVEHDCVPFSIREYRNLKSTEQVDMQRKTMEDPLILIKQREMESRRKLLENPVKLKEIHRLLKSEQERATKHSKKSKKGKKSKKKKCKGDYSDDSDSNSDLDKRLARQMKKLKGEGTHDDFKLDKLLDAKYRTLTKQLDLATKKKKKNKKNSKRHDSDTSSSDDSSEDSESEREEPVKRSSRRGAKHGRSNRSTDEDIKDHRERSISRSLERIKRKERGQKKKQDERADGGKKCRHRSKSRSPDRINRKGREMKRKYRDESYSSPDRRTKTKERKNEGKKRRDRSNSSSGDRIKRKERDNDRKQRKSSSCSSSDKRTNRKERPNGGKKSRYSNSPDRKKHMERENDRKQRTPERSGKRPPTPPVGRNTPPPQATKTPATSKPKLTETERKERLREMMENATWREADRTKAVHKHREEYAREEAQNQARDFDKQFINKEVKKAIDNQTSIGNRIRSNLNNIQRTSAAMDSNFARK